MFASHMIKCFFVSTNLEFVLNYFAFYGAEYEPTVDGCEVHSAPL